jgi:hypothetical protein
MIIRQISFMGPSPYDPSVFCSPDTAIPCASFRYTACVGAKTACYTFRGAGRFFRKAVGSPAPVMDLLDLGPDFIEMSPDTVDTKAQCF